MFEEIIIIVIIMSMMYYKCRKGKQDYDDSSSCNHKRTKWTIRPTWRMTNR